MIEAIDVRDLLGQPGSSREVRVRGTLEDLGTELAGVPTPTFFHVATTLS